HLALGHGQVDTVQGAGGPECFDEVTDLDGCAHRGSPGWFDRVISILNVCSVGGKGDFHDSGRVLPSRAVGGYRLAVTTRSTASLNAGWSWTLCSFPASTSALPPPRSTSRAIATYSAFQFPWITRVGIVANIEA